MDHRPHFDASFQQAVAYGSKSQYAQLFSGEQNARLLSGLGSMAAMREKQPSRI